MTHDDSADSGTMITSDQSALVVDPDGSFRLLLPNLPDNSTAGLGQMLIAAIAVKMGDADWVREMLQVLEQARKNLG